MSFKRWRDVPCEAKVKDLELTVLVDGNVRRLQVPVDDARRVDVPVEFRYIYSPNKRTSSILHAADDLVDEELDVVVGKLLSLDDVVQVSSHQVGHLDTVDWVRKKGYYYHVDISKLVKCVLRCEAVEKSNDLKVAYISKNKKLRLLKIRSKVLKLIV